MISSGLQFHDIAVVLFERVTRSGEGQRVLDGCDLRDGDNAATGAYVRSAVLHRVQCALWDGCLCLLELSV